MAIPLTADQRAALRGHAIAIRTLIDIYLDSGRYSFWDGGENFTYDGATYVDASAFASVSAISAGQDLGAEGVTLTLNGTKLLEAAGDPSDPAAILGTIENEIYQLRRVEIRFAFFSAETGELLLVVRRYAGLIDQARQEEEMGEGAVASLLVLAVESIVRRYGRRGGRTRSHEDQQEIWLGDTFFKYTASAVGRAGTLFWGRKPPGSGAVSGAVASTGPIHQYNDRLTQIF